MAFWIWVILGMPHCSLNSKVLKCSRPRSAHWNCKIGRVCWLLIWRWKTCKMKFMKVYAQEWNKLGTKELQSLQTSRKNLKNLLGLSRAKFSEEIDGLNLNLALFPPLIMESSVPSKSLLVFSFPFVRQTLWKSDTLSPHSERLQKRPAGVSAPWWKSMFPPPRVAVCIMLVTPMAGGKGCVIWQPRSVGWRAGSVPPSALLGYSPVLTLLCL